MQAAQDLWLMYQKAGLMLEMANCAARNNTTIDPELLATLRSDALQIRYFALLALSRSARIQVNEWSTGSADRARAVYDDMVQRTTELLQAKVDLLVPCPTSSM